VYNQPLGTSFKDTLVRIQDTQTTFDNGLFGLTGLTLNNGGTGYTSAPTIALTGGGGSGAAATAVLGTGKVASFTVTNGGSGYTSAPTVSISGAGGTGATATAVLAAGGSVKTVTVTAGGNAYTTAPTVTFSPPQIAGGVAATGTAVVSSRRVSSVTITNSGSGYTSAPTLTFSGGGGSGAAATSTLGRAVANVNVVNAGSGYTSAPTVSFSGGGGSGVAATAVLSRSVASLTLDNAGLGYTSAPTVSFSGGGGGGATATATITVRFDLQPKSIIENFDPDYGRMNALLGVEVPNTTGINQTSIPYADVDPPTEVIKSTDHPELTPLGSLNDGTQIWKITHNGVDTHTLHWHLYDVQVLNRTGWDGLIRQPDPAELGWKETVRVSPLEDTFVAMRPIIPKLPFGVPDSVRLLDPTMPAGSTVGFNQAGVGGTNLNIVNEKVNMGWEYVWHCHLLSHEEMDMMRPVEVSVSTTKPDAPVLAQTGTSSAFTWTDGTPVGTNFSLWGNEKNEIGFRLERANVVNNVVGPYTVVGRTLANTTGFTDPSAVSGKSYRYRAVAYNASGDAFSNTVSLTYGLLGLSGQVTANATARVGAVVTAYTTAGANMGSSTTDASGNYNFSLLPGSYKLYIQPNLAGYANQWFGGATNALATVINLTAATTTNIPLVGTPSFALSGVVTAVLGPTPGVLVGAKVNVYNAATGAALTSVTSTAGGNYTVNLPAGTYKLFVQPNKTGYPSQWFGGASIGTATVITVSNATTQNIALHT
jgi:hypothetical protein